MSEPVVLRVRLTPRGGRDRIDGWADDPDHPGKRLLKVRVSAAPVDGAANEALVKLMAKALGVARSDVEITAGQTARIKTLRIDGTDEQAVARLG